MLILLWTVPIYQIIEFKWQIRLSVIQIKWQIRVKALIVLFVKNCTKMSFKENEIKKTRPSTFVSLQWNHLPTNMRILFSHYRREKKYTDVSVIVEGKEIHAHRIVLSVGSKFFRNLFENASQSLPVIGNFLFFF